MSPVRLIAVFAAAALVVVACSGDDTGDATAESAATASAATPTEAAGADTTGAVTTTDGEPDATEATGTASPVDGPLTDSWRGVTADTITVGVAVPSAEDLAEIDPDADPDSPSANDLYQAWIDDLNARGGILGRQVEMVFEPFLPTSETAADATCVALTEDAEVFVVFGIFIGDSMLCVTETHETPYIGMWGQSAEREERSRTPFIAMEMADDRQRSASVEAFIERGDLDDAAVALYTESSDAAVTENVIQPLLDEAGIDTAIDMTLDDYGDDTAARDQALDAVVERMRAENVDTILNVSNFGPLAAALQRNGWLPEQLLSTSAQSISDDYREGYGLGDDTMSPVTVIAPYTGERDALASDSMVQECVDIYNDSRPESPIDIDEAEQPVLNSIGYFCASFQVFEQAATAAGTELTPDTFGDGADSLGTLELPGIPYGSLEPGKRSVGDTVGVYEYDADSATMRLVGDPIEAG